MRRKASPTATAAGCSAQISFKDAVGRYKKAVDKGLLKTMSKMGISVISSYRGGYNFEAIGLSRALVAEFFPGMQSRISGVGLSGIARRLLATHKAGLEQRFVTLPVGGNYKLRRSGETHAFDGGLIHTLQVPCASDSYELYRRYADAVRRLPPVALRDLLDFRHERCTRFAVDQVESITEIRKRLIAPGISLGALSPEAHETLSIAMNRIGARSDSGEGGEDPARAKPRPNGDNASSAIKQIASGRFGVTAEYLNNCREIEIKVAQGAKPGEGGQLPGFKVTALIARLRHATPGVTLISPPPHHDIYSIEDLAQLIYDLKQINPDATVCVKLVARSGIGTIAAGVAKAKADAILVSGHVGGTGASPLSFGEICRPAVGNGCFGSAPGADAQPAAPPHQAARGWRHQDRPGRGYCRHARCRGIRHRHRIARRHGLHHGAPMPFQHLPGRRLHAGRSASREIRRYAGEGHQPVFLHCRRRARHPRQSRLSANWRISSAAATFCNRSAAAPTCSTISTSTRSLLRPMPARYARHLHAETGRNEVPETLDAQMIADAQPLFERGEKMQLQYSIRNTHRAIGTQAFPAASCANTA